MNKIGRKGVSLLCVLVLFLSFGIKVSATGTDTQSERTVAAAATRDGEVKVSSRLWELLFGNEEEKVLLIPGGAVFGAKIKQSYVTVSEAGEAKGAKAGDVILSIDGIEIKSIKDVKAAVSASEGKTMTLECKRGDTRITATVTPKKVGNDYKLGMLLKDGAAGIGTITYIDPKTGEFGGLGHGICDTGSGEPIEIVGGEVTGVILGGVQKGEDGKPGELRGILTDKHLGEVYCNTSCGVFGRLDTIPSENEATCLAIAKKEEVHEGEATILSTIKNGKPSEFKIKITDIDCASDGSKSFKIKVTDPALITLTGGIVRGMSGSPIIQDGKLVGAVTHVMVANSTEGYGIFIENMLSAANEGALPKVA